MKYSVSLKQNRDFRRLYAKGKSAADSRLVLYHRFNSSPGNRLGITVSTKIGNAVIRNKLRRRLKEIYRVNEQLFRTGHDIVAVARVKSRETPYHELEASFLRLAKKLALLR